MIEQARVFISYSTENTAFVNALISGLEQSNLEVWFDQRNLKLGSDWRQSLRQAIREAFALVLVVTPASSVSRYVLAELEIARMYKRPIFPVWAEGNAWPETAPIDLISTQYINARGDAFQGAVAQLAQALLDVAPHALKTTTTSQIPAQDFEPRNPYKGLRAFQESDQQDFFGREAFVDRLLNTIAGLPNNQRLLSIIGPSGSGKSSVVMAGLLPRLKAGQDLDSQGWHYLNRIVPGAHPLESLALALGGALPQRSYSAIREDLLDPAGRGLHLLARQIAQDSQGRVILFVDQFEELFTQIAEDNTEERQQFINLLVTAVTESDGPITVIVTLRADFYDQPLLYPELYSLMRHHQAVPPLSLDDLRLIIEKPAGLPDVQLTFEGSLVGDLLYEVRDEAGGLPLLQFTLDQLFDQRVNHKLTLAAYRTIGGLRGALTRHAEHTYAALPSRAHQRLARRLFLRLIEPGATEHDSTRRRADLSELSMPDEEQTRILQEVVDVFIAARLIVADDAAGHPAVEISHEALIREWDHLRDWLQEARADLRLQRAISADTATWVSAGKQLSDDRLYRGTVLQEARRWMSRNEPSVNEAAFIEAASNLEARLAEEEQHRKAREAETAKRAEQFELRARQFRRASLLLTFVGLVAFIISGQAITQQNIANQVVVTAKAELTVVAQDVQRQIDVGESLRLALAAQQLYESGDAFDALSLALEAASADDPPVTTHRILADLGYGSPVRQAYVGHTGSVLSVAVSPDGHKILSGSGFPQNAVLLWDLETGAIERSMEGHSNEVRSVAFSPDGKRGVSASFDRSVILWDLTTGENIETLQGHQGPVNTVAFSPDGKMIASGSGLPENAIMLWTLEDDAPPRVFNGHSAAVNAVDFSPNGHTFVSASDDHTVVLWDAKSGEKQLLGQYQAEILSVAYSSDGRLVAAGTADHRVLLWDVANRELVRTLQGQDGPVTSVDFSPDGRTLVSGSTDRTLIIWDVTSGALLQTLQGHKGPVNTVSFAADEHLLVSGSGQTENLMLLWEVRGDLVHTFRGHTAAIGAVTFSPDGRRALTAAFNQELMLWEVDTGTLLRTLRGHRSNINSVAFSPDGRRALSASSDRTLILWDMESGTQIRQLVGHGGPVTSVAFSPDGSTAVSGSSDRTLILWDLDSGEKRLTFSGHQGDVLSVAFSPDAQTILSGSFDHTLRLWNAETGELIRTFTGHTTEVLSVAFSPDGQTVLSGSGLPENRLILWDLMTGEALREFNGHTASVNSVAFDLQAKMILSGARDNTLILWDIDSGQPIHTYRGHTESVNSIALSPDGHTVLSGSSDTTAILWRVDTLDSLISWIYANRLVYPLSCELIHNFQINSACPEVDETG